MAVFAVFVVFVVLVVLVVLAVEVAVVVGVVVVVVVVRVQALHRTIWDGSLKQAMEPNGLRHHGTGAKRSPEIRSQTSTPVQPKKGTNQAKQREPKEEDAKDLRAEMEDVASRDNQVHDILEDIRDLQDQIKSS